MNFDKYAEALARHNDQLLEELNKANQPHLKPEAQSTGRPFQRAHKPAGNAASLATEAFTTRHQQNRVQSALFPGVDPKLARFED